MIVALCQPNHLLKMQTINKDTKLIHDRKAKEVADDDFKDPKVGEPLDV